MKTLKKLAGFSFLILLLASCSGLSELPTSWGNNASSPDIKPTGYNPETKTGWMSYNDSTHIYFAFSFFDPRVQIRILTSGMTVFIDTTGKMKEGCFVRFPMIKREIISGVQTSQSLQPRQGAGRGQRTSTDMLLDQAQAFELLWTKGTEVEQLNPSLQKSDFKTSIGLDSTNALNIVIGVPLKKINAGGLPALDDMVIGLRFGQTPVGPVGGSSRPQGSGGGQQSISTGSSAGTGGGGGGATSSPSPQVERGGGGGQGPVDNSPIEFWYKTRVAKR
jgi:hypothetical protein